MAKTSFSVFMINRTKLIRTGDISFGVVNLLGIRRRKWAAAKGNRFVEKEKNASLMEIP